MKVAVFLDLNLNQINGVTNCYNEMINYLKKHPEHQALFVTYGSKNKEKRVGQNIRINEINTIRYNIPCNLEYPLLYLRKPYKRILRICKEFKPDILHTATPIVPRGIGSAAMDVGKELGIKVVGSYHTHIIKYNTIYMEQLSKEKRISLHRVLAISGSLLYYVKYRNTWLSRNFPEELIQINKYTGLTKKILLGSHFASQLRVLKYNECDVVFAPTEEVVGYLSNIIPRTKIELLTRGVDTKRFSPKWRNKLFRKKYGLDGKKVLLYVGRISIEKNLDKVVEYYEKAKNKNKNTTLLIVGDGPYRKELENKHQDITFTGYLTGKDLSEAYASSDEFIFLSGTECSPNVINEAVASGLKLTECNQGTRLRTWDHVFDDYFHNIRLGLKDKNANPL